MTINCSQLRDIIIKPALIAIGLNSEAAINLLLGTAAQESNMGTYVKQTTGPALGLFQCEPLTYDDIWDRLVQPSVAMKAKIQLYCGYSGKPAAKRLMFDMSLATI